MSSVHLNRRIQRELELLVSQDVLTREAAVALAERYPSTRWDLLVFARWLTLLGALTSAAGVVIRLRHVGSWLRISEVGLGLATPGLVFVARYLRETRRLAKTAATLELMGALALQGLITALAVDFSTGQHRWPTLVGSCAVVMLAVAYALPNRLVLIVAFVDGFAWLAGSTSYQYGGYWLGMSDRMRFLLASFLLLGMAYVHAKFARGAHQAFSRVFLHVGLLVGNLALWFFSCFGAWPPSTSADEQIFWSFTWALVAAGSLIAAGKLGQRALRSYGVTFLVINLSTLYFQFVALKSPDFWFGHLLIAGGSLVAVGIWLERFLRRAPPEPVPPPSP